MPLQKKGLKMRKCKLCDRVDWGMIDGLCILCHKEFRLYRLPSETVDQYVARFREEKHECRNS